MGRRSRPALIALALTWVTAVTALASLPAAAAADGPVAPTAVNYWARVGHAPRGLDAQVIDGYLTVWLRVAPGRQVTVLDYRGAPWVRYDRAGVAVNTNSEEYYLSQVPIPETPPGSLTAHTPPHWVQVSSGHAYKWRDGRLHAFAAVALAPGRTYVGPWRIPVLVNGRPASISGTIFHRDSPSLVWFWPIAVMLACALAAWRVRDERLDRRLSRSLAWVLLGAIALAGVALYLHGRPSVTAGQLLALAVILAGVAVAAWRLARNRSGYPLLFVIAFASLWAGLTMSPALLHGYVLLALPAFVDRVVAVLLLGGGASLVLLALRALDASARRGRGAKGATQVAA
jgi:hypothetical protein